MVAMLRLLLLPALAVFVSANCASYCHWDIVNCQNQISCGECESCQGEDVQEKIQEAIAKTAKTSPAKAKQSAAIRGQCENWCSAIHARSHCSDDRCSNCNFCAGETKQQTAGCDNWCKKEHGHCPDSRCAGCSACVGMKSCKAVDERDMTVASCENWCREPYKADHCLKCACTTCSFCGGAMAPTARGVETGLQAPLSVPLKPKKDRENKPPSEELECYALHYPDIMSGFCKGDIKTCPWDAIQQHWETSGIAEGRDLDCSADDVKCYALRYKDLLQGFCNGRLERCPWKSILEHWSSHGRHNGLTLDCKQQDTICYANRYPDLLARYCHGNVNECDWVGLLTHWSEQGSPEMREFSCAPKPPPLLPPPPPPRMTSSPPPPSMTMAPLSSMDAAATSSSAVGQAAPSIIAATAAVAPPSESDDGPLLDGTTLLIMGAIAIVGVACAFGALCVLRQGTNSGHEVVTMDEEDDYDEEDYGDDFDDYEEPEPETRPRRKGKKNKKSKRRSYE